MPHLNDLLKEAQGYADQYKRERDEALDELKSVEDMLAQRCRLHNIAKAQRDEALAQRDALRAHVRDLARALREVMRQAPIVSDADQAAHGFAEAVLERAEIEALADLDERSGDDAQS